MSAPASDASAALLAAWSAYRGSAATARAEAHRLRRWRWRVLLLTLAGTLASALGEALRDATAGAPWAQNAPAFAGAVLLALATYFGAALLTEARQRRWTRHRSVAEALKSECFRFVSQVPPYAGAQAQAHLLDRTAALTGALGADAAPVVDSQPDLAAPLSTEDYLKKRVDDQRQWYLGRAQQASERLVRYRRASTALGALAALLPIVGALLDTEGPGSWAAVATTAATAIGGFVYAERFAYLAQSYTATANRLALHKARWQSSARDAAAGRALVTDVERALATENSAWMAELMRDGNS